MVRGNEIPFLSGFLLLIFRSDEQEEFLVDDEII